MNNKVRRYIHKFIVGYLNNCDGAFHHGEYGVSGRYVAIMNEREYELYQYYVKEQK